MKLTPQQVNDLDEVLWYNERHEVDSFQEEWRDCLDAYDQHTHGRNEFSEAVAALEKKIEQDGDTAEEMDALARVSTGHVYCHIVRLRDRLKRHQARIDRQVGKGSRRR